ncbi:hypothetical protein VPH35_091336 [Triticum aestivum]
MDGGGRTHARTRDRAAEAAPDGEVGRRRSHAHEAGQLHAPDGEAGWGRREAAPSRQGCQHGDGGRPHASDGEARRRRHEEAARTGRGGWKKFLPSYASDVCIVGLDQTANSHVETMMLTDAPLLYTPGQVNQLHLPGMKEMMHANRKLKHCLDPSSHDDIDKNQFYYGVIIITRRKAPGLIISMLLC